MISDGFMPDDREGRVLDDARCVSRRLRLCGPCGLGIFDICRIAHIDAVIRFVQGPPLYTWYTG